jgi:CRP/FNR family cyclic AMP-dependent transcriptional regulator
MSANAALLADIPMFTLLDEAERATLAELLESHHYDRGHTIFQFGDAGDTVYIVRSGRIQVFVENNQGEKIVLAENEPGDVFGEISLLDGGPRTANAIVIDDAEVLEFDRDDLYFLIKQHPHSALDMLTVMGRRLRATDELLRTHITRNLNIEEDERLTFGQRIADKVASFGGSWTFIITFGLFLSAWMLLNVILALRAYDPYPFILLNLMLSALAALQAPVIMMSQNRQASKDRLKADLDYEVNLKSELEVAQLHSKMDKIYEQMQAHFARMEKPNILKAISSAPPNNTQ